MNDPKPLSIQVEASTLRQMLSTAKRALSPKVIFSDSVEDMRQNAYAQRGESLKFIINKLEALNIPEEP